MTTTEQVEVAPGYAVTRDGRVISLQGFRGQPRELRPWPDSDGYPQVRIVLGDVRVTKKVHALVAQAFCGPKPSPKHEVRHLNGDRTDNNADNIAWGTRKENAQDREYHGRTSRGAAHSKILRRSESDLRKIASHDALVAALGAIVEAGRLLSREDCARIFDEDSTLLAEARAALAAAKGEA